MNIEDELNTRIAAQKFFVGMTLSGREPATAFTREPMGDVWVLFAQMLERSPTLEEAAVFVNEWKAQHEAWKTLEAWREGQR